MTTVFGTSEISGLYQIDPEFESLSEYTFGTTYEQKIRVQTSPKFYNYARLTVNFNQHYERNKEQFSTAILRFEKFTQIIRMDPTNCAGEHRFLVGQAGF